MSEPLAIESLEINNFRAFPHLTIEKLGRVNLITGKNNVGKTTLLEALWLYASHSPIDVGQEIIKRREQEWVSDEEPDNLLFDPTKNLLITSKPNARTTSPSTYRYSDGRGNYQNVDTMDVTRIPWHHLANESIIDGEAIFVGSHGLSRKAVSDLWEKIELTDTEDEIVKSLHLMHKDIVRVDFKGKSELLVARIKGISKPVPFATLGDGMNRLFGITLALVNAQNGILLLDEVENGLHYTVLPDVWRLIFATAKRLNVQVFATTHSWDCLEAFQHASAEDECTDGVLVRLQRDEAGSVTASVFNEESLAIVTEAGIEVR